MKWQKSESCLPFGTTPVALEVHTSTTLGAFGGGWKNCPRLASSTPLLSFIRFMEFEAEEEQQIQKMKLLASCSQFQAPAPKATKPPVSPVPESGQQQGSVFLQSCAA